MVNQILTGISKEENNQSATTGSKSKPIRLKVEEVRVVWDIPVAVGSYEAQRFNVFLTKLSDEQVRLTLRKMGERGWKDYIKIRLVMVE